MSSSDANANSANPYPRSPKASGPKLRDTAANNTKFSTARPPLSAKYHTEFSRFPFTTDRKLVG